ncbi:MAG TPA: TolC family protein [Thermoanaerobaculia bacterium]|nr:TolC family protein [Thermoanaerobaculia bacterium]
MTEEEFVASVGPDHPAVAALEERIGIAEAAVLDATTLDAPEVAVAREDPSGDGARGVEQLDLTVAWELPRRSRRATIEAAQIRAKAARSTTRLDGLALRSELRAAFAEWAIATEETRILSEHAERLEALSARETRRAQRGEVPGLSARRLELAAAEARSSLALARAEAEAARRVAAGWSPTLAQGHPVLPPVPQPPDAANLATVGAHPRLVVIEQQLEAARLEGQAARRLEALPELIAGWQRQDDGVASLDGPLIGISWRLPLVDPNRGARAEAAARVAGAQARLEQARRALHAEREAAVGSLRVLLEALVAARESAAAVEPLITGTVRAFELGEVEVLELLDVLRSVADANSSVLELEEAAFAADRRLDLLAASSSSP